MRLNRSSRKKPTMVRKGIVVPPLMALGGSLRHNSSNPGTAGSASLPIPPKVRAACARNQNVRVVQALYQCRHDHFGFGMDPSDSENGIVAYHRVVCVIPAGVWGAPVGLMVRYDPGSREWLVEETGGDRWQISRSAGGTALLAWNPKQRGP